MARSIAGDWAEGSNTTVVRTSFLGSHLVILVQDVDNVLPSGDLAADLSGAVPTWTPVAIDWVTGQKMELGTVP